MAEDGSMVKSQFYQLSR